jgi:hypothetical protein
VSISASWAVVMKRVLTDRWLTDRWPTAAGIATVPVLMALGIFDDFAEGVVVAAVLYLAWGVLRRRPGQGG